MQSGGRMRARETTRGSEAAWQEGARRPRWTEAIAQAVFRAQEAEGSTLWGFCQRHGLSYARARFWKQRQGRAEPPLSFVPVKVSTDADAEPRERGAGGLELEVSGVRVHVREGASQELIARVVRVLQEGGAC